MPSGGWLASKRRCSPISCIGQRPRITERVLSALHEMRSTAVPVAPVPDRTKLSNEVSGRRRCLHAGASQTLFLQELGFYVTAGSRSRNDQVF
jgi:uncharacterized Zn-binding protein involved in type VI secretion